MWQAKTDFSLMGRGYIQQDGLADSIRGLQVKVHVPGSDTGNGGDGGIAMLTKPGASRETFNQMRRPRRTEASTSPAPVDQIWNNRCGPLDATVMEMGEFGNKEPRSVV